MGFNVSQHQADRDIVIMTVTPPWDWNGMYDALDALSALRQRVNYTTLIVDVTHVPIPPVGSLIHMRNAVKLLVLIPDLRLVIVGESSIARSLGNVIQQVFPKTLDFIFHANDVDAGLALARARRRPGLHTPTSA